MFLSLTWHSCRKTGCIFMLCIRAILKSETRFKKVRYQDVLMLDVVRVRRIGCKTFLVYAVLKNKVNWKPKDRMRADWSEEFEKNLRETIVSYRQ